MTLEAPVTEAQAPAAARAEEQAVPTKTAATMEASAAAASAPAAAASAPAAAASAPNPPLAEAPTPPATADDAQRATASEEDEASSARRWASLLSAARAEAQAAFLLRRVGACPRCCLRFAGVRDAAAFAPPAPSSAALLAELIGSEGGGEGEGNGKGNNGKEEEGERESPCSVCLGVLQSPEPSFRLPLPSDKMAAAAASLDMGAGAWVAVESGTGESVAAVVERQGHASSLSSSLRQTTSTTSTAAPPRVVSLQVSFPASVGLRQAAASAALAAAGLPPAKPTRRSSYGGGSGVGGSSSSSSSSSSSLGPDSITDVKDAAKAAVSPALARALGRDGGVKVTAANDDAASLTVSLQYVHPPTAGELEQFFPALVGGKRSRQGGRGSVFVPSGGSEGKGCWKKRKRVPAADCAALGRAASQALMAGCGALDLAALRRAGFPVPPPRPPSSGGGDGAAAAAASEGTALHLLVRARAAPLFVGGRYLKLQRDVSQSPFFDENGDRRGRTSVQEEIERVVLPLFGGQKVEGEGEAGGEAAAAAAAAAATGEEEEQEQGGEASEQRQQRPGGCDGCKFITAGREDLDVRCLGKGRPFVLEIANARLRGGGPPSQRALDAARQRLKASACGVELDALSMVGKKELVAIKEGETSKQKSYEALCWLPVEVDEGILAAVNGAVRRAEEEEGAAGEKKGLVLQQTTPARVEHRRAMLVRPRAIHEMSAVRVPGEPQQLLLRLRTQAGLYVKEFVHGDGGRTVPSLVDVAGVREKLLEEKRKRKREKDLPAAAANDAAAPAAATALSSEDVVDDAEEEIEAAKCLSLDVCEIHLDFLL